MSFGNRWLKKPLLEYPVVDIAGGYRDMSQPKMSIGCFELTDSRSIKMEFANFLIKGVPLKQKAEDEEISENDKKDEPSHGDHQNRKIVSYRTEIVGGVVVRTPVEHSRTFWFWPLLTPAIEASLFVKPPSAPKPVGNNQSDSDSEDDVIAKTKTSQRSTSPSSVQQVIPATTGRSVIKAGWCVKQGLVRKSWKRRFFVLDNLGISYFKSDQDKVPIRTIPQKDITSCQVSLLGPQLQRDNLYEISCSGRIFYVQPHRLGYVTSVYLDTQDRASSVPKNQLSTYKVS
ncbi:pleckstrin homology domain-containing family A member 1-like [Anneissia japonica]|uniref:pleckstrin homology domain-containing family A member 1-like n=1 Tax=Anneissia japonica TaxID=1529436 RepID=UPI0014258EAD|nr:pleckstrin homology domain-containing family A member 1-like [Anneissia japonica]